jgi:hypothetical protein
MSERLSHMCGFASAWQPGYQELRSMHQDKLDGTLRHSAKACCDFRNRIIDSVVRPVTSTTR